MAILVGNKVKIKEIKQAAYDALVKAGTVDPLTIYNIVDAPGAVLLSGDQTIGGDKTFSRAITIDGSTAAVYIRNPNAESLYGYLRMGVTYAFYGVRLLEGEQNWQNGFYLYPTETRAIKTFKCSVATPENANSDILARTDWVNTKIAAMTASIVNGNSSELLVRAATPTITDDDGNETVATISELKQAQIDLLVAKQKLSSTDYINQKIADAETWGTEQEVAELKEKYAPVAAERAEWRVQVRELETKVAELEQEGEDVVQA